MKLRKPILPRRSVAEKIKTIPTLDIIKFYIRYFYSDCFAVVIHNSKKASEEIAMIQIMKRDNLEKYLEMAEGNHITIFKFEDMLEAENFFLSLGNRAEVLIHFYVLGQLTAWNRKEV